MDIDTKTNILQGTVVKGLKMSDGSPVEGYVVGFSPFTYIIPREVIEAACCTGQQQIKITIVAERILPHK